MAGQKSSRGKWGLCFVLLLSYSKMKQLEFHFECENLVFLGIRRLDDRQWSIASYRCEDCGMKIDFSASDQQVYLNKEFDPTKWKTRVQWLPNLSQESV